MPLFMRWLHWLGRTEFKPALAAALNRSQKACELTASQPLGEPFNPESQEAMAMVENPDAEPNSVMDVMQKGYILNERLIRPAMVVVAKAPETGEG